MRGIHDGFDISGGHIARPPRAVFRIPSENRARSLVYERMSLANSDGTARYQLRANAFNGVKMYRALLGHILACKKISIGIILAGNVYFD